MNDEIGIAAGAIWKALSNKGEVQLPKLRKETDVRQPVFDWAIGWLAREDKIVIKRERGSCHISLKGNGA